MEKYWKMKTTTEPRRLEIQPKFKTKWCCRKYQKIEWNRCSSWGSATSSMNFGVPIYLATAPAEPKIQHPTPWQLHPACDSSRSPAFTVTLAKSKDLRIWYIWYCITKNEDISILGKIKAQIQKKGCPKYRSNDVTLQNLKCPFEGQSRLF